MIVTGGAGFIGSAVCRYIVQETDHTVINVDKLTYAANLSSLQSIAGNSRYSFIRADICDRKAIEEHRKGKTVVFVYPVDKWVLMLLLENGPRWDVRNLGDVRWLATEDGSAGKGTGRHIACFILEPAA